MIFSDAQSTPLMWHLDIIARFGLPVAVVTLALVIGGLVLLFQRPGIPLRAGYTVLTAVPGILGLMKSILGLMRAFPNLADTSNMLPALAETSASLDFGVFGSALGMSLACLIWLKPLPKAAVVPPPFPT